MQPHFVAPLTLRGRSLVALIHDEETRLVAEQKLSVGGGIHVAQEGFVAMVQQSYYRRIPRIGDFQKALSVRDRDVTKLPE